MPQPEQSRDDTSTQSHREEQGKKGQTTDDAASQPAPSLGASIRGAVGSEGAAEEETGSRGADANRTAARERGT